MKLDLANKALLFNLHSNSRMAETRLAKSMYKSKESARYRIKQLEKNVIAGYSLIVDPSVLGYVSGKLYLNLKQKRSRIDELKQTLLTHDNVFWFGLATGSWEVGVTFFVKTQKHFYDIKNELTAQFSDIILDSHTAVLVDVLMKQLTPFGESKKVDVYWNNEKTLTLDNLDKKILSSLFTNSRAHIVQIAQKVDSNVETVRQRMKKLKERGVIVRYVTNFHYEKLGYTFHKLFLTFSHFDKKVQERLFEFFIGEPALLSMVKQISPWDVELELLSESNKDFLELLGRIETVFADELLKIDTAIIYEDYVFPNGMSF